MSASAQPLGGNAGPKNARPQETFVRSNNTKTRIGAFLNRVPLRYRAALWLLLGAVLWLMTGSRWFLIAAAPAAVFVLLTAVNSLLLFIGRRRQTAKE